MLNKSIAFGLLAAGLMIAPTAAFAGQSQVNTSETTQDAAAFDGSSVRQNSRTDNNQTQVGVSRDRGSRYHGRRGCRTADQSQDNFASTRQAGAAENGSRVRQNSRTEGNQVQVAGC